jgi:hypothetical protein
VNPLDTILDQSVSLEAILAVALCCHYGEPLPRAVKWDVGAMDKLKSDQ